MRWLRLAAFLATLLAPAVLGDGAVFAAYYPASQGCTQQVAISQTASTDVKTFTNNGYICYIMLVSATAQSISITQGTGTTCATSAVALIGSTTVANGMALAANSGFSFLAGAGNFLKTTTTGQHLCVLQSSSGTVSGVIGYLDAT